jgi:hypothetical protein
VQVDEKRAQRMMMWKMILMCHLPWLILVAEERVLLVPVAVGQKEMQKLRRRMVLRVKWRKKCLMWKKSTLPTMLT